jgi:hypothetical protein
MTPDVKKHVADQVLGLGFVADQAQYEPIHPHMVTRERTCMASLSPAAIRVMSASSDVIGFLAVGKFEWSDADYACSSIMLPRPRPRSAFLS